MYTNYPIIKHVVAAPGSTRMTVPLVEFKITGNPQYNVCTLDHVSFELLLGMVLRIQWNTQGPFVVEHAR